MKYLVIVGFAILTLLAYVLSNLSTQMGKEIAMATPNQYQVLEARVNILEGQVKELRRVVGLEGGLSEGLQNRRKK